VLANIHLRLATCTGHPIMEPTPAAPAKCTRMVGSNPPKIQPRLSFDFLSLHAVSSNNLLQQPDSLKPTTTTAGLVISGSVISPVAAKQVVQHTALLLTLLTITACVQQQKIQTCKRRMQARKHQAQQPNTKQAQV
jgi:hypothetical protein